MCQGYTGQGQQYGRRTAKMVETACPTVRHVLSGRGIVLTQHLWVGWGVGCGCGQFDSTRAETA